MTLKSLSARRAAHGFAAAFLALATVGAFAQDPAPAEETAPPADPAAAETPAEAPAADGTAPAEGTPADAPAPAETVEQTIPVNTDEKPESPGTTQLDAIQVTGSRLKRSDYETAQPVVTISRDDILRSGQTDLNELLKRLNVAGNNTITPAFGRSFTSMGEANLDLRNLGGQHTLLLVNGRRWVTGLVSTQPNISDLNTIPTAIIERIEVLKDGASAIYGSDAIAGVVNIITRKDYDGMGLDYQTGMYISEGDGANRQASFDWGAVKQSESLFLNLSYTEQERAEARNHDFTKSPMPMAGYTRWGNATPRGRYVFVPTSENGSYYMCPNINNAGIGLVPAPSNPTVTMIGTQTAPAPAGLQLCDLHTLREPDFDPATNPDQRSNYRQQVKTDGEDLYNQFLDGTLTPPVKRYAAFAQYTHEFAERTTFSVDGFYNFRDSTTVSYSKTILGGNAFGADLAYVTADNPTNPFQQPVGTSQAVEPGYGAWLIRTQTADTFGQKVDTWRLSAGWKGDFDLFDQFVSWDFGHIRAANKIQELTPTQRFDRTAQALGTDTENGVYDASICTAPCVPLNVFQGVGGIDPAALAYIFDDVGQKNRNSQSITYFDLAGELPEISWLAGPIAAATGIEVRRDTYENINDPTLRVPGLTGLNAQDDSHGKSEAREAYVEFGVPLLKELPFADVLDLDLAGRYSQYPGFDNVVTYKTGLRWQPIEDLLLRGTYSTGFRAPSIAELYYPGGQSFEPLQDPCVSGPNNPQSATTQANCNADNVVGANSVTSAPYNLWQGNLDLEPEESVNITYGFIYSPHFVPDLNIGMDFYKITVDKFILIGPPLGQNFLDSCYKTAEREHCEKVHRDTNQPDPNVPQTVQGDILYVDVPFTNLGKIDTAGIDFDVDYILPLPAVVGQFKIRGDASYLQQFDQTYPRAGQSDLVDRRIGKTNGLYNSYPRWKAQTELQWHRELWRASWTSRLAYHLQEPCNDLLTPSYRELGLCSNPVAPVFDDPATTDVDETQPDMSTNKLRSVVYHNLQIGREIPGYNADVTIGVNNVLDQDPPYSFSLIGSRLWFNYDPTAYETPGRFGYVRVSFKF
jgi:iron complex outermembrane recepter protein